MSRFTFEIPSETEAREFVDWRQRGSMYQGELYADALTCVRRLEPVTHEGERYSAREQNLTDRTNPDTANKTLASHPCTRCDRFAFAAPTLCFWCRGGTRGDPC